METKNINEVAPNKKVFEEVEQTTKDEVLGKEILLKGYAKLTGNDGEFGILLMKDDDKLKTCTVNTIMLEKLEEVANNIGINEAQSNKTEKIFSEPVTAKIETRKSQNNGKDYYVFA